MMIHCILKNYSELNSSVLSTKLLFMFTCSKIDLRKYVELVVNISIGNQGTKSYNGDGSQFFGNFSQFNLMIYVTEFLEKTINNKYLFNFCFCFVIRAIYTRNNTHAIKMITTESFVRI